jgi:hypothetical protein
MLINEARDASVWSIKKSLVLPLRPEFLQDKDTEAKSGA